MRQHVPLSHAFPLLAPTRRSACVVIITFRVCMAVRASLSHVSFGAMRSPNLQLLQFSLGCVPLPFRFPHYAGRPFALLFLFLHGLQFKYVYMYVLRAGVFVARV